MVAIAPHYGFRQSYCSGFLHQIRVPASCNNSSQQMTISLDIIETTYWCLPVCCSREFTERVLELLEMVYTDNLKGTMTPLIHEFKLRAA